ncbi:uncharacterized protein RJT20DRAFT_5644 [Scheffersomyces xylosifermentans]|uniref:uncharacterized protein n=1 Tax=Scheffersomyces xylosifermentans TaxID=1304137 RepID=UPI00315CFD9E
MSRASIDNTTSLFIDKNQAPKKDQGIIDIGKNCSKCSELDFLPFHCEFCNLTFCSKHRTLESHDCAGIEKFQRSRTSSPPYEGPSAKTLFPDSDQRKRVLNERLNNAKPKPTNILDKQFRVGDIAAYTPNAFSKLNKFLKIQREKSKSSSSTLGKIFNSKPRAASNNKVVELAQLRKQAKGDSKISVNDRVYIWALYVNGQKDSESNSNSRESDEFSRINVEKDRKPIFVSKNWVVGRALDSIADNLQIKNINNSTNKSDERLNIFKLDETEAPILIQNNIKSS